MLSISGLIRYWLLFELINWFIYLVIYINILTPRYLYLKNKDTEKIIKRIDKLSKNELEYAIKGCIIYNKNKHESIQDESQVDINEITIKEITIIIGYSLFGIDINKISTHSKYNEIIKLITNIEKILEIKFKNEDGDKFLYRKWGSEFIKFSSRPLILQITIRILVNYFHYYFVWTRGYDYSVCEKTKISYLSKISNEHQNPEKETLFFIHGFGLGYIPYYKIILELEKKYNIVLIVLPNISSYRFYDELMYIYFPSLIDIKESIYSFAEQKKIQNSILLSHSFGTYIARILERDSRSKIFKKIIMIDPIIFWIGCFKMCIHMSNPSIRIDSLKNYLFDILGNFIIYDCIYHQYVCFRTMFGPDFWIYDSKELVNLNITMVLEKGDYIIPAELIYNKIKDKTKCYYVDDDKVVHGTILTNSQYTVDIFNIIEM
jgi:hypothetical protein